LNDRFSRHAEPSTDVGDEAHREVASVAVGAQTLIFRIDAKNALLPHSYTTADGWLGERSKPKQAITQIVQVRHRDLRQPCVFRARVAEALALPLYTVCSWRAQAVAERSIFGTC